MRQYKTAVDQANKLLEAQVQSSTIDSWKAKIRELIAELVLEGTTDAPSAAATVVIEGEATIQDVDFAVAHCNWKQIGIKEQYFDWEKEVQVIPRLRWVLARVRDELLIWDYDKEEVVHFITLDQPYWKNKITTCHLIDMPELNAVIYFRGFHKMFSIVNLQGLAPRGGRTDFDKLSLPIVLRAGDLYDGTYSYFVENASLLYSNVACIVTSKDDNGQWRLALSHIDRRGVSIYKAGDRRRTSMVL